MPDPYQNLPPSVTDPSFDYFVFTPSDSAANNFARSANSIRVALVAMSWRFAAMARL